MKYVKRIKENKLSTEVQSLAKNTKSPKGVCGDYGQRVKPGYTEKTDRRVIEAPDNAAAIIMDNNPKYASKGGDFASRIAIVAGVKGHKLNGDDEIDDLSPIDDAAGVYILQKDDPQAFLGRQILVNPGIINATEKIDPKDGIDKTKSHVTAYADTIQLVARNGGVNLYAGGIDKTLSTGVDNVGGLGVNLIYGNKIEKPDADSLYSLQSIAKAENINKLLREIYQTKRDQAASSFELTLARPDTPINPVVWKELGNLAINYINSVFSEINSSILSKGYIGSKWNKTN